MTVQLDHLVIAAADLESGRAWAAQTLGAEIPPGGRHSQMGTHNAVARLDAPAFGPDVYLEIIAIDPAAPPPDCPRWFGLDAPDLQADLRTNGPRLLTWMIRSSNLAATLAASPLALGVATPMSRGAVQWTIAITADGRLPADGLMPGVLQWPSGPHVARQMAAVGLTLDSLELLSDAPAALDAALSAIGARSFALISDVPREMPARVSAKLRRADGRHVVL